MADRLRALVLVAGMITLGACAEAYHQPYRLAHGTGTWERARSCPVDGESFACLRAPSPPSRPGDTPYPDNLFITDLIDDPCSQKALEIERPYYPSLVNGTAHGQGDAALPLLGVALSGGGARSASTSIGFLAGLDRQGILAQADLISSVSGGSYASYWFFSHLYNAKVRAPDESQIVLHPGQTKNRYAELFHDEHRFQLQVADNSHLGSKAQGRVTSRLEMAAEVLTWLPTIPLHWLTAGLFDRKNNLNPLTHYYHAGIERAYGLYPEQMRPSPYRNASGLRFLNTELPFVPRFEANDPSAEQIKSLHVAWDSPPPGFVPPFWVINATAVYGGKAKMLREADWGGFSHDLRDTVYEFTPIHYGSPRLGYCPYELRERRGDVYDGCKPVDPSYLKYGRIVGASGAAVDGVNPTVNILLDVFNIAIGRYINNPRVDDSVRLAHQWLPFPLYGFHRATHDEAAPRIYLTDGGHAENLGVYALVKRRVKNILVLDAEYEGRSGQGLYAGFEALQELRCRLYAEHGLRLMIAEEGKDPSREPLFPDGKGSGPSDRTPCSTVARSGLQYSLLDRPFPYLEGWICLDGSAVCADDARRLNVFYVKLAIGQKLAQLESDGPAARDAECRPDHRYQCSVRTYFQAHQQTFPHDSTADISYTKTQYRAYRDLGFDLARCLTFTTAHRLMRDPTQAACADPSH